VTDSRPNRRRATTIVVVVGLLAAGVLLAPSTASASGASSCAKAIVDDWFGNNRVDKIYPLHCYLEAIRSLPVDVKIYTGAEDDILRALAFAKKGKVDPGRVPSSGSGTDSDPTAPGATDPTPTDPATTDPTSTETTDTAVDTSGPSSIPLPLILLGGLSLLLLAAGGAGYLNRRAEARRTDSFDDDAL
jgi:hypothetical protein